MWVWETKACVTRRSSRADNGATSPRSNSRARRPKRKSMNSAGSEKGSLTSRGCTSQVMSSPFSFDRRERAAGGARHRARQRSREGPLYALFDCRKKDAENAAAASQGALRLRPPLANFLQDAFTQQIGIALAGFGEFDDSLGDDFIGEIAAVRKPKGYASHFERDAQDALGLGVEFGVVQEWGDRHGCPSSRRRERDRSLSHRRLWEPLPVVMKS